MTSGLRSREANSMVFDLTSGILPNEGSIEARIVPEAAEIAESAD